MKPLDPHGRCIRPTNGARASVLVAISAVTALLVQAGDQTYPTLDLGDRVLTNACVVQATPVDLVFRHRAGFSRVKLQDLPPSLKARYPYDPGQATQFEQARKERDAALQEQDRQEIRARLMRKEAGLVGQIAQLERQLDGLQKQLCLLNRSARGKPHSSYRKQADRLRELKGDHLRQLDAARQALDSVRATLLQYL